MENQKKKLETQSSYQIKKLHQARVGGVCHLTGRIARHHITLFGTTTVFNKLDDFLAQPITHGLKREREGKQDKPNGDAR
jgi:hypothetical protein